LIRVQFIGGFKGDWEKAPSGQNQEEKRKLLESEGVVFDQQGYLVDGGCWWDGFKVAGGGEQVG
jgi:methylated-DNA-[protein]-cysteine S-methyltransferase